MIAQIAEERLWNQIVARAWCDEALMQRLLAEPREVLAEHGLALPPDTEVEVVEGSEVGIDGSSAVRRFILSACPSGELMEEELMGDAVGYYCYSYSGACGACGACGCRCRCRC